MDSQISTVKNNSVASKLCGCISWKNKKLIPPVNLNTLKWKMFKHKKEEQTLPEILALLIDLYDGKDVFEGLEACRINRDYTSKEPIRNDLEYYVPQLTNLMMFHDDSSDAKLNNFLENLSKADPYFAHLYYWYVNSLSVAADEAKGQKVTQSILEACSRESQTKVFIRDYDRFYTALEKKLDKDDFESKLNDIKTRQSKMSGIIQKYKESPKDLDELDFELKASDIELKSYVSPFFSGSDAYFSNPFTSSLLFFEDMYLIAQAMTRADDKLKFLKRRLRKVNMCFPAPVYIPFVNDSRRYYSILDIAVDESRVYSTKERAPFYICFELFKPHEELAYEYNEMFYKSHGAIKHASKKTLVNWAKEALIAKAKNYIKMDPEAEEGPRDEDFKISKLDQFISSPVSLKHPSELYVMSPIKEGDYGKGPLHIEGSLRTLTSPDQIGMAEEKSSTLNKKKAPATASEFCPANFTFQDSPLRITSRDRRLSLVNELNTLKPSAFRKNNKSCGVEECESPTGKQGSPLVEHNTTQNISTEVDAFFGESSKDQADRIRMNSPFKDLKTWKLLHVIVKTGADMKEEQFAIQLVSQFDQIFKAENLNLILTPFEIMSLGPDIGLVEAVRDTITISGLKEKMYQKNIASLNDFFEHYWGKDVEKARRRFCKSLAAYSLICYLLQIKDRHNSNILLHRQGHIVHIDFGFFLSNAPGRGLEFEKKVPFKLLNEYIEVLGGHRSSLFQEFRKYFYKGFMAARKHREQILILVKMMYSSQGANLPCFKAGLKTITELEQRFCPPNVAEKDLMSYCYDLINQSLDNWRAKCYDKYQYYVQGILY